MARVRLLQDMATARGLRAEGSLYVCSEAEAGRLVAAGIAVMVEDEPESAALAQPETAVRRPARPRQLRVAGGGAGGRSLLE